MGGDNRVKAANQNLILALLWGAIIGMLLLEADKLPFVALTLVAVPLVFLKKRPKTISESELDHTLNHLLYAHTDATLLVREDNLKILISNEVASRLFLYSTQELVNKPIKDLIPNLNTEVISSADHDNNQQPNFFLRTTALRKDSSQFQGDLTLIKIKKDGVSYLALYLKDLSEYLEIENQLFHSAKLSSIGELAGGIGHEINNPLAIASGNHRRIQKFIDKHQVDIPEIITSLEKMKLAHSRIRTIVDGLRVYARNDSDHISVISTRDAIQQTLSLLQEVAQFDHLTVETDYGSSEHFVYGSLGKMQQVVMNLLSNAKDATANNKEKIIRINLNSDNDGNVVISISDNGIGMPPEIMDKIFNPFFTTKKVGEGTGMGMGIIKKIVESMQGKISVESTLGEGTTFHISIPEHRESLVADHEETITGFDILPFRALVVDDEDEIREILKDQLVDLNAEVSCASTAEEAMQLVAVNQYDFIITDVRMPDIDGIALIKKISHAKLEYKPNIIMITGGVQDFMSNIEENEDLHLVIGTLFKPIDDLKLRKMIAKAQSSNLEFVA